MSDARQWADRLRELWVKHCGRRFGGWLRMSFYRPFIIAIVAMTEHIWLEYHWEYNILGSINTENRLQYLARINSIVFPPNYFCLFPVDGAIGRKWHLNVNRKICSKRIWPTWKRAARTTLLYFCLLQFFECVRSVHYTQIEMYG